MATRIEIDGRIQNRKLPDSFKARKPPELKAENASGMATIRIYDTIGPDWAGMVGADTIARALDDLDSADPIAVRINSGGGDVFEGVAIYNLLAERAGDVHVSIDGLAASIASVIAMAGDTIAMSEAGQFMIHRPYGILLGDADEMRAYADILDSIQGSIAGVYQARTGRSEDEIAGWINAETWMTAAESLDRGFIDSVTPNKKARKDDPAPTEPENNEVAAIRARNRVRLLQLKTIDT